MYTDQLTPGLTFVISLPAHWMSPRVGSMLTIKLSNIPQTQKQNISEHISGILKSVTKVNIGLKFNDC